MLPQQMNSGRIIIHNHIKNLQPAFHTTKSGLRYLFSNLIVTIPDFSLTAQIIIKFLIKWVDLLKLQIA